MDSSVAIAAAYLQLNGYFVLTELPVQVADRHGYRTATDLDLLAVRLPHAAELVPGRQAHARDLLLGQDPLRPDAVRPKMTDAHASTLARDGSIETRTADGHPCRIRLASFAGESASLSGGVLCVSLDHRTETVWVAGLQEAQLLAIAAVALALAWASWPRPLGARPT